MTEEEAGIFFFNDTATTEIYTLSLHDALPICRVVLPLEAGTGQAPHSLANAASERMRSGSSPTSSSISEAVSRSEEHTSELQSRQYLVCRLLLEKKSRLQVNHLCTSEPSR